MQVAAGICGTSASHWDPVEVVLTIQVNSQDVFFWRTQLARSWDGGKVGRGADQNWEKVFVPSPTWRAH